MNIVHRDIKAENILIKTRFDIPLIRIGDFGISTVLKNNEKCKGVVGSVIFMSPEIFNQ